jgi:hypothetical protein
MRKTKKLFQLVIVAGVLFFTNACSEDEIMDDLNQTLDKYEFNDEASDDKKTKPPGNGG